MPENPASDTTSQKAGPVGPTVGIIIIVILLFLGALYFWGQRLNRENPNDNIPYIPGDATSTSGINVNIVSTTTLE